ncbi:MAG: DUF429 domain-containing protein, partial [Planctomycetaceae bacterium]|nr:DUF429 domain-containing protein [Planctomycetaceae bacterium]
MTQKARHQHTSPAAGIAVAGIDVGGEQKGFHAVKLTEGQYVSSFSTRNAKEMSRWCSGDLQVQVIAVDAPCRWGKDGRSRPAERALMQERISCFSTPTREQAVAHRTNNYGWMLRGEELFRELEGDFQICRELPRQGQKCCFETYPHAITWNPRGGNADASRKWEQRRELLAQAGVALTNLTSIDLVDAALCALVAYHAATGKACKSYGEPDTGLIIVP